MIFYNECTWGIWFAYSCAGSVIHKGMAWSLPFAILSAFFNWLTSNSELAQKWLPTDGVLEICKGYQVALAFLILFRTQIVYSRMIDGVSLLEQMRSSWVNVVSCCSAFCSEKPEKRDEVTKFQKHLIRLVSLLYGVSLQSLHKSESVGSYTIYDVGAIDPKKIEWLLEQTHKPEIVMQWVQQHIISAHRSGAVDIAPPILSRVFQGLEAGLRSLAGAQKMNAVPFPFPYAQMISIFLQAHTLFTCISAALAVKSPIGSAALTWMVCMAYWTLNYVAMELEYPFGDDPNDLPLHNIQDELNDRIIVFLDSCTLTTPAPIEKRASGKVQILNIPRGSISQAMGRNVTFADAKRRTVQTPQKFNWKKGDPRMNGDMKTVTIPSHVIPKEQEKVVEVGIEERKASSEQICASQVDCSAPESNEPVEDEGTAKVQDVQQKSSEGNAGKLKKVGKSSTDPSKVQASTSRGVKFEKE
eukprot:TRINITY_DN10663_c0_g1_i3.p1 TRINITY_DN10663_c0_g1~~TRINITY_DN10663_c0_g1_i3.p1  ORF type:complete len:471 (+),score=39.85 TRINITY_DN10663_c0_g1_i3:145-1557(+)